MGTISPGKSDELNDQGAATGVPRSKRALDIACCLIALPVLCACTLVAATVMRVASPGPVFFLQERVGYQGRRFKLIKFRTMHVAADVSSHRAHFADLVRQNGAMRKLDLQHDGRLIPGARLLRLLGLDELPQIINVLRGDMSMVGPRPCIPYEYAHYSSAQRRRFCAAPGLTGLWQVSGKNRTTFERMIELDIQYVDARSLRLDLLILLLTPRAVWRQLSDARDAARAGVGGSRAAS